VSILLGVDNPWETDVAVEFDSTDLGGEETFPVPGRGCFGGDLTFLGSGVEPGRAGGGDILRCTAGGRTSPGSGGISMGGDET